MPLDRTVGRPRFNETASRAPAEDQGAQNGARTIVSRVLHQDDCPPTRHAFVQVKGFSGIPVPPPKDLFAQVRPDVMTGSGALPQPPCGRASCNSRAAPGGGASEILAVRSGSSSVTLVLASRRPCSSS